VRAASCRFGKTERVALGEPVTEDGYGTAVQRVSRGFGLKLIARVRYVGWQRRNMLLH
jgi:hypothetical protein